MRLIPRSACTFTILSFCVSVAFCAQPAPREPSEPVLPAHPAERKLSLDDLQAAALSSRPALLAASARIRAAQARALQAGLRPNPTIGYTAEEIGTDGTAGLQGAFVEQRFLCGDKLYLRRMAELRLVTREELLAEAVRMQVVAGVRGRFYSVLAAERLVELRRDLLATAQDAVRTATQLKNNGKINRQDELLAIIEARQVALELETARNLHYAAWRDLASFIGDPQAPLTKLDGDLGRLSQPLDEQESLLLILETSPRVAAAYADISRAEAVVQRERAQAIPDVNLRLGSQYSYETNDPTAFVEVGVALPLFNRNQGNIMAAQAELSEARASAREFELGLIRRHAAVFARYEIARMQFDSYRRQLNDATEMFGLYQEAFNARMASYQQVLIAQRTYIRLQVGYVESLRAAWEAEAGLEGLLLDEERPQMERVEAGNAGDSMYDLPGQPE